MRQREVKPREPEGRGLRELTEEETVRVAGGQIACTNEPGVKVLVWFATAGMAPTSTMSGGFSCW